MKFVISGGWSYGNIGDEVIAKSTIELFENTFENSNIVYTSFNTDDFEKSHNRKAIDSVHKILKNGINTVKDFELIKADINKYGLKDYSDNFDNDTVFVMSGGGYFSESWESQFVSRLIELFIAHENGAKIIVIGQSMGPVFSDYGKTVLAQMLNYCDYLSVRDISTQGFLNSLNINIDVEHNPDLAVIISDITQKMQSEKCINIMAAAYSTYRNINSKKKIRFFEKIKKRLSLKGVKYKKEWKKLIDVLSKKYKLRFVMSVNWKWDRDFVNYLTDFGKLANVEIITSNTAEELCSYLSQGSMIISTKMHPVIVSVSYGIPSIAISYDYKVDDFMKLINKSEWCFKNYEINADKINNVVDYCMNNQNKIEINCQTQKEQVYKMMEKIKNTINEENRGKIKN